jgi:hypothetical protein
MHASGVCASMVVWRRSTATIGTACLLILTGLSLASCGAKVVSRTVAASPTSTTASCPATLASQMPFVPPAPYPSKPPGAEFWFGTPQLWTSLPTTGSWANLPYERGAYVQKVFWGRGNYDWRSEPAQQLIVRGVRIDGTAKPLVASAATNAFSSDIGSFMLVLVDVPTSGCWRITGIYQDTQLSFVVSIQA